MATYSSTGAWLAGVLGLVPALGILGILGLYSLYLGLPVLMKTRKRHWATGPSSELWRLWSSWASAS